MMSTTTYPSRTDGQSTYVTVGEAAEHLRKSRRGVRQWLVDGKLRGKKVGNWAWRVERASVEEALPAPPLVVVTPEPPTVERVLGLLGELTDDERKRVAVACLTR
jgi:excisionase family DNA binding protein